MTDLTIPRLNCGLSLGAGPRPGRDQSPGRIPMLDGDLSLRGGLRPRRDQGLGRGPRKARRRSKSWKSIRIGEDQSLGEDPRLGGDRKLGRCIILGGDL